MQVKIYAAISFPVVLWSCLAPAGQMPLDFRPMLWLSLPFSGILVLTVVIARTGVIVLAAGLVSGMFVGPVVQPSRVQAI